MHRLILFLKGMTMGAADVIPGVSGGTMALILGIYTELVDTIKGLSPRILLIGLRWLKSRDAAAKDAFLAEFERLNLLFLLTLFAGIVSAIIVGSAVIPSLMESYPSAMRAFFFGLILASVYVPLKMVGTPTPKTLVAVAIAGVLGGLFGFNFTNPSHSFETTSTWKSVESNEGETLKDITRREPSAWAADRVFWAPENQSLRAALSHASPEKFAELEKLHLGEGEDVVDKEVMKARAKPYESLELPAGTPVKVPQPAIWFVFVAGLIAICAMILPGISGSYLLLILGLYFFILNSLKGFLTTLASGSLPLSQGTFVAVFCLGCLIGLLSFARLLSYLLHNYTAPTLGGLVGLMLGCLRGIWPFRTTTAAGLEQNMIPAELSSEVLIAVGCGVVGMVIVAGLTWLGGKTEEVSHA